MSQTSRDTSRNFRNTSCGFQEMWRIPQDISLEIQNMSESLQNMYSGSGVVLRTSRNSSYCLCDVREESHLLRSNLGWSSRHK